ncbi:hypothetical protein [Terrihabitans sp. B22-R8]|uniref:hypothetical protein n=1 Tax=Terrihabitans sp. B22-R8 TaxID=3425128 RepID=UPI00403D4C37
MAKGETFAMDRTGPRQPLAALFARLLLAWVLSLQPMVAGFATAQAMGAPHLDVICRGSVAEDSRQGDDGGTGLPGHSICCLSGCVAAAAGAPPSARVFVPAEPSLIATPQFGARAGTELSPAGLGPQAARAPPAFSL